MKLRWNKTLKPLPLLVVAALIAGESLGATSPYNVSITDKKEIERSKNKEDKSTDTQEKIVKTKTETYNVNVELSNKGAEKVSGELEWYFIGEPLDKNGRGKDAAILNSGKKSVTIDAKSKLKESFSADFSVEETESTSLTAEDPLITKTIKGEEYKGHVILLRVNNEIVATGGSSRYQKEEWLKQCKPSTGKGGKGGKNRK